MSTHRLESSDRAPYLLIGPGVEIPDGVYLGAHVVLHEGTRLGRDCHIEHGAVIGRASKVNAGSSSPPAKVALTIIGPGTIIGCYSVVCAGAVTGENAFIGDHSLVRERARIGAGASIGHAGTVGRDAVIGNATRLQGYCALATGIVIEENCLIGPHVVVLAGTLMRPNDDRSPGPAIIRRGSRIGSAAQIMSGVEIGAGAIVGAAAVVTRDVPAGSLVRGSPARVVGPNPRTS
jgi:UDP-2-acetamido-3-amino-2,3-dideoxy-glucuronate N-acetyltransferase